MQDRIEGKCASSEQSGTFDKWSAAKATQTPGTIILTTSELGEEASVLLSPEDASRLGRFLLAAAGLDVDKLEVERDELRARVSQPEPSADIVDEMARIGWDAEAAAIRETGAARPTWLEASEGSYYRTGIRAVLSALATKGVDALPSEERLRNMKAAADNAEADYSRESFGIDGATGWIPSLAPMLLESVRHLRAIAPIFAAKDAELERMRDEIFEGAQREDTLTKERNELRGLYRMAVKALDAATKEAEVLRAKVAELEAAVAAAESGKCPTCGATLTVREGGGALVKTCPTHGFVMRGCKVIDD